MPADQLKDPKAAEDNLNDMMIVFLTRSVIQEKEKVKMLTTQREDLQLLNENLKRAIIMTDNERNRDQK